jgi:outer membrane protein OmpA-like peptidoglycan-associated protein
MSSAMHLTLRIATVLLAVSVPAASAGAQSGAAGQIEIGTYGAMTTYDSVTVGLDTKSGAGGRLGWYFTRAFAVELNGDYTLTEDKLTRADVNVARVGGTLLAYATFIPLGTPYLGAGYERLYYRGALRGDDKGWHVLIGDRLSLGGRAAIRVEGRAAYFPNSSISVSGDTPLNLTGTLGISIYAFGGPPRDSDGDKVANNDDQCPDTPLGAMVDPQGCPTDQDGDGAFDGLDNCPDTPGGALVNEFGCPTDEDRDTVYDGIDVCPNTPVGAAVDENGCPLDGDLDAVFDGLDQCPATPSGATVDASGCPVDGDGDGVFDGLDLCPGTPAGTAVDESGCPADSDSDGVVDAVDQCPDTPPGTAVDATGCAADSDSDGVPNDIDQCPATPLGTVVDSRGCPDRDTDGDSVLDSQDRCPNTAPGQSVDAVGCPILFVVEQGVRRPLVLEGVQFRSGRSALTEESFAVLDEVAASLLAHLDVRIEIGGYTDNTGRRSTNMRLSRERAQSVKAYLARKGVDPGRMVAVGYGPEQPIATNATPAGRAQNRRVELKILEQEQQ